MTKWEDREYELVLGAGGPLKPPVNYKFKMQRKVTTEDGHFYSVVLSSGSATPPYPFTGIVLLPQGGKRLIHYLAPKNRLDPISATYEDDLGLLLDEIIHAKIEADPDGYERLVGVVPIPPQPVNLITLYKVEHTHVKGALLVVVFLRTVGAAPGGSIGVVGR